MTRISLISFLSSVLSVKSVVHLSGQYVSKKSQDTDCAFGCFEVNVDSNVTADPFSEIATTGQPGTNGSEATSVLPTLFHLTQKSHGAF